MILYVSTHAQCVACVGKNLFRRKIPKKYSGHPLPASRGCHEKNSSLGQSREDPAEYYFMVFQLQGCNSFPLMESTRNIHKFSLEKKSYFCHEL